MSVVLPGELDLGGYPRIIGNSSDMGAFELFYPGDFNFDGSIDLLDIQFIINYLYKSGSEPHGLDAADINNDKLVNILDIVFIINYKYKGGSAPVCD